MSERTEHTTDFRFNPKRTWLPLSAVIGVSMALGSIHVWLNRELTGIQSELMLIRQTMENQSRENWDRADMYNWTYQLKENNRELFVPNPVANPRPSGGGG